MQDKPTYTTEVAATQTLQADPELVPTWQSAALLVRLGNRGQFLVWCSRRTQPRHKHAKQAREKSN